MSVPISEQETVIQISRDSNYAKIWTSDTTMMTKLDKFAEDDENQYWEVVSVGMVGEDVVSKEYKTLKKVVSFRSGANQRVYTEEERKAQAARLAEARKSRQNEI